MFFLTSRNNKVFFLLLGLIWLSLFCCVASSVAQNSLVKSATWQLPTQQSVKTAFAGWAETSNLSADVIQQMDDFMAADFLVGNVEVLDLVFDAMVIAQPELNEVREQLRQQRQTNRVPDFTHWLDDPGKPAFVQHHVRLVLARWLAQNEFYDESLSHLEKLAVSDVIDPATLLFYRGLMEHQLLKQDACIDSMQQLLEHEDRLPRRFEVLAKLMIADIRPLEPDSLDEIARLMADVRRRTGLHRSGKIVRDQEQDVINKLDKLIEKMEAQQAQMQPGSSSAPSTPMQDSHQAGGKGDGEVNRKPQHDGGQWGDMPPSQRAAALAEMAKDMPPHYRAVIEEYFRQLAAEDK